MYAFKNGQKETVYPFNFDVDVETLEGTKRKWLEKKRKARKGFHTNPSYYLDEPMFLDTETSHDGEKCGWIHQWCIRWCNQYIIGRSASDLMVFLMEVNRWARSKGKTKKVMIYIQNLSYDMEYMRQFFPEHEPEFFGVKAHRILNAHYENLMFRCTFLLTGKSLAKWAKDSNADHQKLVGTYDYDRVITPSDPLTDEDWMYQLNDCAAMYDSWHYDRSIDGYTTATVPQTSTGFVRRDCLEASKKEKSWRKHLRGIQPEPEVYKALELAFAGGYTHGNRFEKLKTIISKIGHRDFRSSYPARQMLNKFPMGKFIRSTYDSIEEIIEEKDSTATLVHIALNNIRIKDGITAPYLGASKCIMFDNGIEPVKDNGRILYLDGACHTWVTELDLEILLKQYDFDYQIIECYSTKKDYLPEWLRGKVMEYFLNKTTLKHADYALYMLAKAMLNGIYGMTATKSVRPELQYNEGEWSEHQLEGEDFEKALSKYYEDDDTFLFYAWGVWTTALARQALFECIETIGYDRFLYADTDSIFYIMDDETERKMNEYNARIVKMAEERGAIVSYKGEDYALGEFTMEEDMPLQKFRYVHAKCYATVDRNGKLNVTVAGVTKVSGKDRNRTNADELGSIDNLTDGFVFRECGGTRIVYNNDKLHTIVYNGVRIEVGASAVILPTEYKVHNTDTEDASEENQLDLISDNYESDIYNLE